MTRLHACAVAMAVALSRSLFGAQAPAAEQLRPDDAATTADDLLQQARRLRRAGKQAEFLATAEKLRALAPDDPSGHLLVASARASLGPSFAKDVALQAFARVLALAADDLAPVRAQRLIELAAEVGAASKHARLATTRDAVRGWQGELAAGKTLLLAPDLDTLARTSDRAGRRVEQVAGWLTSERKKLSRARQRQKAAERDLARERARAQKPGAGLIDLQPIVDRIASSQRDMAQCERVIREHDLDLKALRAEARRLAGRLAQIESLAPATGRPAGVVQPRSAVSR